MPRGRVWFITGTPGAGKTTLAHRLAARYDRPIIHTGDIARRIDPEALARGDWADPVKFREAMVAEVDRLFSPGTRGEFIVEGYPRSAEQYAEIDEFVSGPDPEGYVFFLTCPPELAFVRLTSRGRADDNEDTIRKRISAQYAAAEVWSKPIPWGQRINTANRTQEYIEETFRRFLDGERKEVF